MDDWLDAAQDDFISSLREEYANDVLAGKDELYGQVIDRFTSERLQSYYLDHPDTAARAFWALEEAHANVGKSPEAVLLFASIASEVGLKGGLLKPILHGLVHDESLAFLIAELVPEQRNDSFQKLLFGILREYGGVDLTTFKRTGIKQTFWEEMKTVQTRRNALIHRGSAISPADAQHALDIAEVVVITLFPQVLDRIGLCVDGHLAVAKADV